MNEGQQTDHAYHEDRLLLLIAQRAKMTADSDLMPALDSEPRLSGILSGRTVL
jgi:hypothetical protein